MAGGGYRLWVAGDIPTATQVNTLWQEQVIPVFASAAARDTALSTVKAEGMCAYLLDLNVLTVYSGAAWSTVGPVHGAPMSWTPAVVQSGAVTTTNVGSTYSRLGRLVFADFILTVTGAGTASNLILVTLPVAPAFTGSALLPIGVGRVFDTSGNLNYPATMEMASATTMAFRTTDLIVNEGRFGLYSGVFTQALAAGDTLNGTIQYQAAADA